MLDGAFAFGLPFAEQIEFFRDKLNIPTRSWDDLWKDQHAKGFMVAGATKADILADFRTAVDKAISQGTTLEEFRKDFDRIVQKHGWSYNGSRAWRSEVIYSTNIRTSYSAGRWAQLTDPEQMQALPYLRYNHGDSRVPRPEHLAWDGVTLPPDDPWWATHYTPNGWGCKCYVTGATKSEYAAAKNAGKGSAPESPIDPKTGEPKGIDKGWGYNVGEAAYGRDQATTMMEEQGAWKDIYPWGPETYGRPGRIAVDVPEATLGQPVARGDADALRFALRSAIGGDEAFLYDPLGEQVVASQAITDHMLAKASRMDGREAYFQFIPELIERPYEIWVNFAKHSASGRVALRKKYVKAIKIGKNRVIGLYAEIQNGLWVSGDFFREGLTGAGNLRKGRLLYGRN
jgi:hypothetical protein